MFAVFSNLMKTLICILLLFVLVNNGFSQVLYFQTPIGQDSIIYCTADPYTVFCTHPSGNDMKDACLYRWQSTINAHSPFYSSYTCIHINPTSDSTFTDSMVIAYRLVQQGSNCNSCQQELSLPLIITAKGYNKDNVKILPEAIKIEFSIFPNPSTNQVKVNCFLSNPNLVHFHIFNELGKDVMTVYDGMLPEGKRDFSFKLPQGMYYVRMETAEGVVTKKVTVQ